MKRNVYHVLELNLRTYVADSKGILVGATVRTSTIMATHSIKDANELFDDLEGDVQPELKPRDQDTTNEYLKLIE